MFLQRHNAVVYMTRVGCVRPYAVKGALEASTIRTRAAARRLDYGGASVPSSSSVAGRDGAARGQSESSATSGKA